MPSSSWGQHQLKPDCASMQGPPSVSLTNGHLTMHQRSKNNSLTSEDPILKTRSGFLQGCCSDGSNPSFDEANGPAKIFSDFSLGLGVGNLQS